jgi:hypothetical protein
MEKTVAPIHRVGPPSDGKGSTTVNPFLRAGTEASRTAGLRPARPIPRDRWLGLKIMAISQEQDGGSHVDGVTGRHSPLPPCSAGQTVVVSNADHDFFCALRWRRPRVGRPPRRQGKKNRPQAVLRAIDFPNSKRGQAITGGRWPRVALRWKNSAWLTTAETVAGWNGLAIRKAGSGRCPVRKRSG